MSFLKGDFQKFRSHFGPSHFGSSHFGSSPKSLLLRLAKARNFCVFIGRMCKVSCCPPAPLLSFDSPRYGHVLVYSSLLAARIVDGYAQASHSKQIIQLNSLIPAKVPLRSARIDARGPDPENLQLEFRHRSRQISPCLQLHSRIRMIRLRVHEVEISSRLLRLWGLLL